MESRGRVMVPVPAKAESGIQGPASAQTLHPRASSILLAFSSFTNHHLQSLVAGVYQGVTTVALDVSL